jgi:hypothetical protein
MISPISDATRGHVGIDTLGQSFSDAGKSFLYKLSSLIDVGIPIKFDKNEGKRNVVHGTESGDAVHSHECIFQGDTDECLNLLGSKSWCFCQDRDSRFRQVRKNFHGKLHNFLYPESQDNSRTGENKRALSKGESYECIEHFESGEKGREVEE